MQSTSSEDILQHHSMEASRIWSAEEKCESGRISMLPQPPASIDRVNDLASTSTQLVPDNSEMESSFKAYNDMDMEEEGPMSTDTAMLRREEYIRMRREWEMANRESERLSREWTRMRQELDEANRQKELTFNENKRLREENHELVVERVKLTNEKARLMQEVHLLRTGAKNLPSAEEKAVEKPPGREKMPFDLRWDCKSCSTTNRRLISSCEFCGAANQLPMYIDGFEVTTPTELKARKAKDKKPFVLINPKTRM